MLPFRKILFPVDYSEPCKAIVPYVQEMRDHFSAELGLIHAYGPEALAYSPLPITDPELPEQARALAEERLGEFAQANFPGLHVELYSGIGEPGAVIHDVVKHQGADLVMLPTHGRSPLRRFLLGSVTAKVLHDSPCAVWTTAHTGTAPDLQHLALKKILCAVDGTADSVNVMRFAAALAKDMSADLRLAHVVPGVEAWPDRQMDVEFEEQLRENAKQRLEELQATAKIDVPSCVAVGSVADSVSEEANRHGADLLVIGRGTIHGTWGRLKTHAYGLIRLAPCPVVSV